MWFFLTCQIFLSLLFFILKPYFVFLLDLIPALGGKQKTEEFFMKLAHMLVEYMNKQQDRATKVSAYSHLRSVHTPMKHCRSAHSYKESMS